MRIAPCEVEMFCPKCGLIKENVFLQALMGDTEKSKKTKKNYYLLIRVKYFFTTQRSWS